MQFSRLLLLLLLASVASGCVTAAGRLNLSPPNRPIQQGKVEVGASVGIAPLNGFYVGNGWLRYGLGGTFSLELDAFANQPFVWGGNVGLRWALIDNPYFSLQLVPGLGMGVHAGLVENPPVFHLSPNLTLVSSFKLGAHSFYLGNRLLLNLAPGAPEIDTFMYSLGLGANFQVAKGWKIHFEILASASHGSSGNLENLIVVPTAGFSVEL